jgi:signal transduction histidine kinase
MIKRLATKRAYLMLFLLVVIVLNCSMVLQFVSKLRHGAPIAVRLTPDFYIVTLIALAGSAVLPSIKTQRIALPLLSVKALLAVLLGVTLADEPIIRTIMLSIVILELEVYGTEPTNTIIALALIFMGALLPQELYVWNIRLSGPSQMSRIQLVVQQCVTLVAGGMFRALLDRMTTLQEQATGLEITVSRLITANKGFQDYAQVAGKAAEREERMRISRDIHDTVGYTLTNLIVMMESATDFSRIDPGKAERLLEQARDLAVKGLEDTRTSLRLLRSVDANRPGGLRMVQELVDTFSGATAIDISIEYGNMPWSLGEEVDAAIYHVTQESLINAFRHGRATQIRIMFWLSEQSVQISISDNGRGAKAIKEGIGFQGMQERVGKLGGSFKAGNEADGFSVLAVIPTAPTKVDDS